MQADYLVLADAATVADGKMYIHGAGWDNVLTPTLPITLTAAVAILIRIPWAETNEEHVIGLDIHDADGHSILPKGPGPLRGKLNVGRPANVEVGEDQVLPLAIGLNGTAIERVGRYVIVLELDGREAARAPFRVKQMQVLQAIPEQQRDEPPPTPKAS
ncbi:MAG: DUF6941 family protein [Thermomicrobiales bacterium]